MFTTSIVHHLKTINIINVKFVGHWQTSKVRIEQFTILKYL